MKDCFWCVSVEPHYWHNNGDLVTPEETQAIYNQLLDQAYASADAGRLIHFTLRTEEP